MAQKEKTVHSRAARKGRVTIPMKFRKHNIREGNNVMFSSRKSGEVTLIAVLKLEDLTGVESKKIRYNKAAQRLDRMRQNDRY